MYIRYLVLFFFRYRFGVTIPTSIPTRNRIAWGSFTSALSWRETKLIMALRSKPKLNCMTSGHISSGLDLTYAPSTITTQQPSENELDLLFEAMYDDYIGGQPSDTARTVSPVQEPQVQAARTMLIFSRAPLFLWVEAIATACFTQNCSIIHRLFNKTSYELINGRKPDISFLHVFGALCYPKNDREDIGKLGAKAMAFEQCIPKPGLQSMTYGQISSGLDLTYAPSTITTQQPTEGELDLLFEVMYDAFIGGQPSAAQRTVPAVQAQQVR
nr:retrovirus-related Pol polyprotein from transposon TNT 1-94 [Tanacetum cinerariifolium]